MTRLARVLLVLLVIGFGLIIYLVVKAGGARTDLLPAEVGVDSVEVYEARADSLEVEADTLMAKLADAGLIEQPAIRNRLGRLRDEITALRTAVEKWRSSRDRYGKNQAYKECVLLYGRASGVCDALQIDTAPPPKPKRLGR